ncbi:MAG: hypothetical protein GXO74_02640 [Calditrichaeota bacterium]|nr:hypothetical protein [Calditrichota bacterium]
MKKYLQKFHETNSVWQPPARAKARDVPHLKSGVHLCRIGFFTAAKNIFLPILSLQLSRAKFIFMQRGGAKKFAF